MTDEIPDDVTERAIDAMSARPVLEAPMSRMRAALRVAVEWEREQCARVADEYTHGNEDEYDYADIGKVVSAKAIAAAIRARSRKD